MRNSPSGWSRAPRRQLAGWQRCVNSREAGVPVGVLVAPIIPGLTDHEGPAILAAAAEAGASYVGWTMLRLPYGVGSLFEEWLENHYPLKKEKVLSLIRDMRGGKLNDKEFGSRMRGEGRYVEGRVDAPAHERPAAGALHARPGTLDAKFSPRGRRATGFVWRLEQFG